MKQLFDLEDKTFRALLVSGVLSRFYFIIDTGIPYQSYVPLG